MEISFLGSGAVKLAGKQASILINPGEEKPKGTYDLVLLGDVDAKNPLGEVMSFSGPGEYEVKNATITGVAARRHIDADGLAATMYSVELDDVRVTVVGNIAPGLSNDQIEALGDPDVLVVPVGGHGLTLDATAAAEVVTKLEPKYVIPVHFDDGASQYPMPQAKLDDFLKEMGSTPEPQPKLKIAARAEMPVETQLVVLERASA